MKFTSKEMLTAVRVGKISFTPEELAELSNLSGKQKKKFISDLKKKYSTGTKNG